jgi:hypothetical protein
LKQVYFIYSYQPILQRDCKFPSQQQPKEFFLIGEALKMLACWPVSEQRLVTTIAQTFSKYPAHSSQP